MNCYLLGEGSNAMVLVPKYKLFLYHIPMKPDLLDFSRISVFTYGLFNRIVTTMIFFALRAPPSPPGLGRQRRAVKMRGCFIAVKIMTINIRSHHLVLRSLGTYWYARVLGKETCCARERRITPSAPYLR